MIDVGTRVKFEWDEYDVTYNIEYEYLGTETKHGIVVDWNYNSKEYMRLKNAGCVKVQVDTKSFGRTVQNFYYVPEQDLKLDNPVSNIMELVESATL